MSRILPYESNIVLSTIKSRVHDITPTAKIFLFGSRVYNLLTEESDWDILILTKLPVSNVIKRNLQNVIFPLSVQIGAFINILTVQEDEWQNNPSYYSIHQTIDGTMVQG